MTDEPRETKDESITKRPVSRREFLKYAGLAGGVVAVGGGLGGLIAACGGTTTTTTAGVTTTMGGATTTGAVTTSTAAQGPTTTAGVTPVAGGTMRHITSAGPQDVGFWPKMGPTDEGPIFPSVERICEYTPDRKLVPFLAKRSAGRFDAPQRVAVTSRLRFYS